MMEIDDKYSEYQVDESAIDTDIKINPDFYIHNAIIKAQAALGSDNLQDGFLKYYMYVEHIETLCDANKIVDEDYYAELKKFKEEDEKYLKEDKPLIKQVLLANKKLNLLMKEIFKKRNVTGTLEL